MLVCSSHTTYMGSYSACYSRYNTNMGSYNVSFSYNTCTGLYSVCLWKCFQGSSMPWHLSTSPSLPRLEISTVCTHVSFMCSFGLSSLPRLTVLVNNTAVNTTMPRLSLCLQICWANTRKQIICQFCASCFKEIMFSVFKKSSSSECFTLVLVSFLPQLSLSSSTLSNTTLCVHHQFTFSRTDRSSFQYLFLTTIGTCDRHLLILPQRVLSLCV